MAGCGIDKVRRTDEKPVETSSALIEISMHGDQGATSWCVLTLVRALHNPYNTFHGFSFTSIGGSSLFLRTCLLFTKG